MKRIALLGLVCFALYGCSDDSGDKVTNEFLVGKWECKLDSYNSKMKDGKFTDYAGEGLDIIIKEEFKIENNKLYCLRESKMDGSTSGNDSNDWKENHIFDTHTGETIEETKNNLTEKSIKSLIKKSHDTYLVREEYITIRNEQYNSGDNIENFRTKVEAIFTRIK